MILISQWQPKNTYRQRIFILQYKKQDDYKYIYWMYTNSEIYTNYFIITSQLLHKIVKKMVKTR